MKSAIWCAACLVMWIVSARCARAACWYDNTGHFTESNYNYNYPAGDASHAFVYVSMSSVASDCPQSVPLSSYLKGRQMHMFRGVVSAVRTGDRVTSIAVTDNVYNMGASSVQVPQPTICSATSFNPRTMLASVGHTGTLTAWREGQTFCATGFIDDVAAAESQPSSAPVQPASGFTCWFDAGGRSTGVDGADSRFPARQVTRGASGGYQSYGFTFEGPSTDCPRQLPANFYMHPPIYLLRGTLSAIQNKRTHATVFLVHDIYSDSDMALAKCAQNRFDPSAIKPYVGKSVLVTGAYNGGEFCATGFVPPS